jgi:hypothetical protein
MHLLFMIWPLQHGAHAISFKNSATHVGRIGPKMGDVMVTQPLLTHTPANRHDDAMVMQKRDCGGARIRDVD